MKTLNISTRLLAIALIASLTLAFTSPALANEDKKIVPVELKFIGNVQENPMFHLVFNGTEEAEYTIVVRDEYGNSLYHETVKGTSFIKKFVLKTETMDDSKLKFEVSSKGYAKPVVFEINTEYRYSENIVVNKVK
jgi:hypothetical protein